MPKADEQQKESKFSLQSSTPTQEPEEQWEDVKTGLGREHDFERSDVLTGFYIGPERVELSIPREDGTNEATAFIFADVETGEQVFVWQSHELSVALEQVSFGDKVRITYLGRENFTGQNGPQQVKRYKVQRAKTAA